ncbi:MAG: MAPEG family protein [Xanthobacteraceae bacterium]
MTPLLSLVVYMAIVTWAALLAASLIRAKGWTLPGMKLAMGNRDNLPPPDALAGRAERAARNTLENFLLFAAIAIVAQIAGVRSPNVLLGAEIFFWSRLVYLAVYYAGIPMLRTAVWGVSIIGLAIMVVAIL